MTGAHRATVAANALPHTFTRKVPQAELLLELTFLKPYQEHVRKQFPLSTYSVRPDNTILYKGSFYSLPLGTYRGKNCEVALQLEQDVLILSDKETKKELCRHKVAATAGIKVANSDHKRDKTAAIQEMIEQVCSLLPDPQKARQWLYMIKKDKPRYIRDQLQIIGGTIAKTEPEKLAKAVDYCLANSITRATDFRAILSLEGKQKSENKIAYLNPLNGNHTRAAALLEPEKSDIEDYQSIVKKS